MDINKRHGGPYDRGGADFYFNRLPNPHYYVNDTYTSERIDANNMSPKEISDYHFGYDEAERFGDRKDWG